MKFGFLDVYYDAHYRISKDTAGGYGTANTLGNGFVSSILTRYIKRAVSWPNLQFVQLMQQLIEDGHHCEYKKFQKKRLNPDCSNFDAIFVCSSIVCFETEIQLVEEISRKFPGVIFLCGSFIKYSDVQLPDSCIAIDGNYDLIKPKTLEAIVNSKSPRSTANSVTLVDNDQIDKLAVIDWGNNGLPVPRNNVISRSRSFIPYIFNRGCPYSCAEYCTYPTAQGRKVMSPSIEKVISDLTTISERFPGSHVVFRDPVFSINKKKSNELITAISEANLNLEFSAELHLKNLDEDFVANAANANFSVFKFGIESAFEHVRNAVKRASVSNDEQYEKVKILRKHGIRSVGMFIIAQPTDSFETCKQTIQYACQLGLDIAQFSVFTPYPGTPYFKFIEPEIRAKKFEEFTQFSLVFSHINLNKSQVNNLLGFAYRKFIFKKLFSSLNFFKS